MLFRHPQPIVYPGHPVTLALVIMAKYESLAGALALGHEFPRALEDESIPGSGGSIFMSLDLLRRIALGEDAEKAVTAADHVWALGRAGGVPEAVEPGQEQADTLKPEFFLRVSEWVKRPET